LARGKLAILDGEPDLGKSLVALDLCARLTRRPFPDGSPGPGAGNAIVLNGEDSYQDTTRPRLEALGADLDRIFVFDREQIGLGEPLSFPSGAARLDVKAGMSPEKRTTRPDFLKKKRAIELPLATKKL
jgi:hypothetical protein